MKRIEINGLGVFVEVYKRKDELEDLQVLKEAVKALQREILKRESRINGNITRQSDNH